MFVRQCCAPAHGEPVEAQATLFLMFVFDLFHRRCTDLKHAKLFVLLAGILAVLAAGCMGNTGVPDLFQAAGGGNMENTKKLIEQHPEKIHEKDKNGMTPLALAAANGKLDIVNLLLEKKSDIHSRSKDGWTPILLATEGGHTEVVAALLERGAEKNDALPNGWTSLHLAADNGTSDTLRLLIGAKANVNAQTGPGSSPEGATPLFFAAKHGYVEIAKMLIEAGAEVNLANSHGKTPMNAAEKHGVKEMIDLLKTHGGKAL